MGAVMKQRLFYLITILLPLLVYTNCSKVDFKDADPQVQNLGSSATPEQLAQVKEACDNGVKKTQDFAISFPNPNQACAWGKNGNMNQLNSYFRARTEQIQKVTLPGDSTLCGVKFDFGTAAKQFKFDDHFLMSLNGSIIASSYEWSGIFEVRNNLFFYNWDQLVGKFWGGNNNPKERTFCAGETENLSRCEWPRTEQTGPIVMDFEDEVFQRVTAQNRDRLEHEIKFVTMGDNDSTDCQHADLSFHVQVKYTTPQ